MIRVDPNRNRFEDMRRSTAIFGISFDGNGKWTQAASLGNMLLFRPSITWSRVPGLFSNLQNPHGIGRTRIWVVKENPPITITVRTRIFAAEIRIIQKGVLRLNSSNVPFSREQRFRNEIPRPPSRADPTRWVIVFNYFNAFSFWTFQYFHKSV